MFMDVPHHENFDDLLNLAEDKVYSSHHTYNCKRTHSIH